MKVGWIVGALYIAIAVGITLGKEGQLSSSTPWTYMDAFWVAIGLTIPFVCGYLAGTDDG